MYEAHKGMMGVTFAPHGVNADETVAICEDLRTGITADRSYVREDGIQA
jgi:hypothetical protein